MVAEGGRKRWGGVRLGIGRQVGKGAQAYSFSASSYDGIQRTSRRRAVFIKGEKGKKGKKAKGRWKMGLEYKYKVG